MVEDKTFQAKAANCCDGSHSLWNFSVQLLVAPIQLLCVLALLGVAVEEYIFIIISFFFISFKKNILITQRQLVQTVCVRDNDIFFVFDLTLNSCYFFRWVAKSDYKKTEKVQITNCKSIHQ
jgi:hypothetical protein